MHACTIYLLQFAYYIYTYMHACVAYTGVVTGGNGGVAIRVGSETEVCGILV